jgi:hypothetical protein
LRWFSQSGSQLVGGAPKPSYPEVQANPATKMSKAPARRLPILDNLIE